MLAMSDGHGSSRSFRSDVGARVAVEALFRGFVDVQRGLDDNGSLSIAKELMEKSLPRCLVNYWEEGVCRHADENPRITSEELMFFKPEYRDRAQNEFDQNLRVAYGATALGVLLTPRYAVYLQLGDGDILAVSAAGKVERPIPLDPRLIANETTSLCAKHAWDEVRVHFQPFTGEWPPLIVVSTDGYSNAFCDDDAFCKVGLDLLRQMRQIGPSAIEAELESWLNEASEQGSGDDVTVGVIYRHDYLAVNGGMPQIGGGV